MSVPAPPRTAAVPRSSGVMRQLLVLQPYHYAYLVFTIVLTLGGLAVSIAYGTNIQNLEASLPRVAHHAKSYWANKHNLFNQAFVKYAMLWNWGVWAIQLVALKTDRVPFLAAAPASAPASLGTRTQQNSVSEPELELELKASGSSSERLAASGPPLAASTKKDDDAPAGMWESISDVSGPTSTSLICMSLLRLVIATFIWLLFASWFFGPSIMYRILVATGGQCVPVHPQSHVGQAASFVLPATVEPSYCVNRLPYSLTVSNSNEPNGEVGQALQTQGLPPPVRTECMHALPQTSWQVILG